MASDSLSPKKRAKSGKKSASASDATLGVAPLPSPWVERYHSIYQDASPELTQLLFAVRATALVLDNAITARLAKTPLSSARYHMLVVIWGWDGPISFTELGACLAVTRATVSALVDGLVRDGIVDRHVDPDDRRNMRVSLTTHGETILKPLLDANFTDMHLAFADFTKSDLTDLLGLLAKFRANAERLLVPNN